MPESPPPTSDASHVQDVERALGLREEDRQGIPGLYSLNVDRVPISRVVSMQVVLAFSAGHNALRDIPVSWALFGVLALVVEAYALVSYVALKRYFTRVRAVHLGTVFLAADLGIFTLMLYATGAERSWLWPLYLIRVADQMWIGRRRAAAMASLSVALFLALMGWVVVAEGRPLAWSDVLLKASMLGAMAAYLVVISKLPWDLQSRTQAAKDLILHLEAQSRALEEERTRAEQASRAKSEFLARMSHELRTPLNSVVGFSNVLLKPKKQGGLTDRDREYLARIRENGVHLLALINDVLDIARIDEGALEFQLSKVPLEPLVRNTVGQLEDRLEGTPVRLAMSFPDRLAPLTADEARLRQILINLVGNAIKFTDEGFVRVEVSADPRTDAPTSLRVVDSGVGIEPGRMEHIFQAFEQGEGSTRRRHGGTGLGLAICHALCRLHGWSLSAESSPGKGSVFTVDFAPPPPPREDAGIANG